MIKIDLYYRYQHEKIDPGTLLWNLSMTFKYAYQKCNYACFYLWQWMLSIYMEYLIYNNWLDLIMTLNTCKPMAVSFQCMTKFTTKEKINKIKWNASMLLLPSHFKKKNNDSLSIFMNFQFIYHSRVINRIYTYTY